MFGLRSMVSRLLLAAALALGAIATDATSASAGCGSDNPNCIVPTSPYGTSNNQAASTAFVQNAIGGFSGVVGPSTPTVQGHIAVWNNTMGTLLGDSPTGTGVVNALGRTAGGANGFGLLSSGGALPLAQGGLGASQSAATANQFPVYPGSAGAAVPTSATTWFDAAYCNTVGYLIVRFTGAWTCSKAIAANPVWWGADPTGTNDSLTALNSVITALGSTSGAIEFPAGLFKFSAQAVLALTSSQTVDIGGVGMDATELWFPNGGNGFVITYTQPAAPPYNYQAGNSVTLHDMALTTSGTSGANNAAFFNGNSETGVPMKQTNIINVAARGHTSTGYWANDFYFQDVQNIVVHNTISYGPYQGSSGNGFQIVGSSNSTTPTQFTISQASITWKAVGILASGYLQGLSASLLNFTGVTQGLVWDTTVAEPQCSVTISQINATTNDINLTNCLQGSIADNLFYGTTAADPLVAIANGSSLTITGNSFDGIANAPDCISFVPGAGSSDNNVVIGNSFQGCTNNVKLVSGVNNNVVANNTAANGTISNAGTGNVIVNNPGYNPIGVTGSNTVGTSPATICAGASPETHYYIQSATNTATIKLGGSGGPQVAELTSTTIPAVVDLGPNECDYVTWTTTAPTYTKSVH